MKREDNKIGHFTSEKGKKDFQIAYDESMVSSLTKLMPGSLIL
ncbi:hypothetical protein bcgnr5406_47110 [Bacillus cereus]|uniref:Carboxylesterase NP n=1 Tax=Bacillus cereus TaxID=1396 RepID=A0A164KEQ6_BACCE|nr:carboxylesterase NP [Bacillus cereus]